MSHHPPEKKRKKKNYSSEELITTYKNTELITYQHTPKTDSNLNIAKQAFPISSAKKVLFGFVCKGQETISDFHS